MILRPQDKLPFGQYSGLTIQQVYQGDPNPDKQACLSYLSRMLSEIPEIVNGIDPEFDDVRKCEIIGSCLYCEPIWADVEFTNGKLVNADVSNLLRGIVAYFFKGDFRGTLQSFENYCHENGLITPTSGNPEYLRWLVNENAISISNEDWLFLRRLPVARIMGFSFFYKGDNQYEIFPEVSVEMFLSKEDNNG